MNLCQKLTYWGWGKMAAILQTTFSSAISWMKMFEFRLKFHWSLFLRDQLTISQHWFRKWLSADQVISHYLNQWWSVYWRIYASLGRNELLGKFHLTITGPIVHEGMSVKCQWMVVIVTSLPVIVCKQYRSKVREQLFHDIPERFTDSWCLNNRVVKRGFAPVIV